MKVAIYGDSYTAGFIDKSINSELAWPEILSHDFNITNFGVGGSSVYYSYRKFLDTHSQYDKVILFLTFPDRIYIERDGVVKHISGMINLEFSLSQTQNIVDKKIFNAAKDYFNYIHNHDQAVMFRSLVKDHILKIRPDIQLFDILYFLKECKQDFEELNDHEIWNRYKDLRQCHFSEERNIAVAKMIKDNIINNTNGIDYNLLNNTIPSKPFEYYFKPFLELGN